MVSGLVTSPCDQLRIFSGDARLMRIASKSAIGFAMSKGLERYKVFLRFLRVLTCPLTALDFSSHFPVLNSRKTRLELWPHLRHREQMPQWLIFKNLARSSSVSVPTQLSTTEDWELRTKNCLSSPPLPAARAPQVSSRPLPP